MNENDESKDPFKENQKKKEDVEKKKKLKFTYNAKFFGFDKKEDKNKSENNDNKKSDN